MINFFKKLFGIEISTSNTKAKGIVNLKSNAPDHWPALQIDYNASLTPNPLHNFMFDSLKYNSVILEALSAFHNSEVKTSYAESVDLIEEDICGSSTVKQLTKDGILMLNSAIKEKGIKYAVLVFRGEINHFTIDRANELLSPYGYKELIWYAPEQPTTSQKNLLEFQEFDATSLSVIKDYKGNFANFAMWWSSANQSKFTSSSACDSITKFNDAIENYETAINGLFGVLLKMHPQVDYVDLPDELMLGLKGPGGEIFLLRISKQRGFNFYFPVNERMVNYRDDFLREMNIFIRSMMVNLKQKGYKPTKGYSDSRRWWNNKVQSQKADEAQYSDTKSLKIFEPFSTNDPRNN
ncbi:hypothetical protein N9B82_04120 [Saprospiraceae bacterium]|nr:hypothetical protein [Saprospiraceae bacterium]